MKINIRKTAKQETLKKILTAASRLLKKNGIEAVSIDEVMDAVGLTRGSFYAYFKSKDDMILKAAAWSIQSSNQVVRSQLAQIQDTDNLLTQFIAFYLSPAHVQNVADGCPVAALSRDISRSKAPLRHNFTNLLSETIEDRRNLMSKIGKAIEREKWIGIMSAYVGALILSRACQGSPLSDEILNSTKKFILQMEGL